MKGNGSMFFLRIRRAGLSVECLCRYSPVTRPSNSKKEYRQILAKPFGVYGLHSLRFGANEGCNLLVSTPYLTRRANATYSSPRRKKSQNESGDWRVYAPRPECAVLARGAISVCILACVESKHDFVMLRGSAPRTPKSKARRTP